MFSSDLKSQTINIDSTFTADAEIYPFSTNDTITGLSISGSIELNSDTSLVRVILVDEDYNEYMIYEAYPMIVTGTHFDITNVCDETCYLNEKVPVSIKIHVVNGQIDLESILLSEDYYSDLDELQYQAKRNYDAVKINNMNSYIQSRGWEWYADSTSFVKQFYSQKRDFFSECYNLLGIEYYVGGVYNNVFLDLLPPSASMLVVPNFDWRKKHDAHIFDAHYWDGDLDTQYNETGNGWMTGIRNQGSCNSCSAFGTVASFEAYINLFYNIHIDATVGVRVSEKDAWNCSLHPGGPTGCHCDTPKLRTTILSYIRNHGVVDELCYPYNAPYCDGVGVDCEFAAQTKCGPEDDHTKFSMVNWNPIYIDNPPIGMTREEHLKRSLIENGPLIINVHKLFGSLKHCVSLVGYIKHNDKTAWIMKNSWGTSTIPNPPSGSNPEYDNGYIICPLSLWSGSEPYIEETVFAIGEPQIIEIVPDPSINHYHVHSFDKDKDGYYNWGIGDMPAGWTPPYYSQDKDWNDNDERIGPRDEDYYGIPVKPDLTVECSGQVINNGGFFTFFEDSEDLIFTVNLQNDGDANLNLFQIDAVTSSNNDVFEIEAQPPVIIPMYVGEVSFNILYNFTSGTGIDEAVITIIFDEIDIDPFEFTIMNINCTFDPVPEIISHVVPWDDWDIKVSDVIVESNSELTITGHYGFVEEASLIIEPGAKVIIDGGHLTKACSDAWQGIDVWGNRSLSQHPTTNQGHLKIINGGCIEYAREAVQVARIQNRQYLPGSTGGIVQCNDAVFRNDTCGIIMYPYQNFNSGTGSDASNRSQFQDTKFITEDNFCHPNSHVSLWGVDGVVIKGCSFSNEVMKDDCLIGGYDKGFGIRSFNAGFYVWELCLNPTLYPCTDVQPCTFSNLDHAVYALNAEFNEPIGIENADFNNNHTGIYMSLISQHRIVGNDFLIDENHDLTNYSGTELVGLNMEHCQDFTVEENSFINSASNISAVGLQVLNAGPHYHEIYNNSFLGLKEGIIASGENRNGSEEGLCIRCNDFSNCITDISIKPDGGYYQNNIGIALQQGEANGLDNGPACNTLTDDYSGLDYNISNTTLNLINYAHHLNQELYKLQPDPYYNVNTINPQPDNDADYSKETSCPSNQGIELLNINSEMSLLASESAQISAYGDTLNQQIDGGDTEGLNFDVQITMPNEALQTTQELLTESPYLSDNVMESTIAKENVFPNAMVRDILVANPQSAKKAVILDALDNRFNPMPDYMMAEIMQGQNTMSTKEVLEQKKTKHIINNTRSLNKLLQYYMNDTLGIAPNDSILALLENEPNTNSQYQRAFIYLESKDSLQVMNVLDNIPIDFEFGNRETTVHNLYCDLFAVLLEMYSDTVPMDSLQEAALLDIEQYDHLIPGVFARNILIHNSTISYIEPVYSSNSLQNYEAWKKDRPPSDKQWKYLKVFPNPAGHYFIIEYDIRNTKGKAIIQIADESGKLISSFGISDKQNQRIIDTGSLSSGLYLIQFLVNNELLETVKISVSK